MGFWVDKLCQAKNMSHRSFRVTVIAYVVMPLFVLAVDLSSKRFVESVLNEGESVQALGGLLRFTLLHNYGTTLGLFSTSAPFLAISILKLLSIGALFVCFLKVEKFIKNARHQLLSRICILVIIGGSCGNVIDRLADRKVTDFIDIGIQTFRWPVFNVADAFQFLGGLTVLLILAWQHLRRGIPNENRSSQ
jgi:signal peptidase II